MAKMSKLAKDIKNQPKLKKQLAEFIAINTKITDAKTLLLEGHRGFLAMSEKELTRLFDEKYDEFNKKLKEAEDYVEERSFYKSSKKVDIEHYKNKIKEADALYESLFEHLFL